MKLTPWFLVFCIAAFVGAQMPFPNAKQRNAHCPYAVLNSPNDAPDILFLGSSAMSNAIDPVYLEKRILAKSGRAVTAEVLEFTSWFPHKFAAGLHNFIENRGSPAVIVYHLPISTASRSDLIPSLYTERDLKVLSLSSLLKVHQASSGAYTGGKIYNLLLANWRSTPEIVSFSIADNILKLINLLNPDSIGECENGIRIRSRLPVGRLNDALNYEEKGWLITLNKSAAKNRLRKHARLFPVNFSKNTESESLRVAKYIATEFGSKSKIYVTFIPHLGVREPFSDEQILGKALSPNAEFIDSANAFVDPESDVFNLELFRDSRHLNYAGAHLVTDFWADLLSTSYQQ